MRPTDPNALRYRELLKLKRKVLNDMRKHRKALAKKRIDKKKINEEITRLRKSGFAFHGLTPAAAQRRVSDEIRGVTPEDIYPKDLERKFDKLERTTEVKYRKGTVDVSDVDDSPTAPRGGKDDDEGVYAVTFDGDDNGVVDLSATDDDTSETGPANEDAD